MSREVEQNGRKAGIKKQAFIMRTKPQGKSGGGDFLK